MQLEFTVPDPPVSQQTHNKTKRIAWREKVRSRAARVWGCQAAVEIQVKITVSYYHARKAVRIDNDNMVKTIQDALIGLVYKDDRLITDTVVRKTSIEGSFQIRGYSLVLLEALSQGDEFLHVVVDRAPDREK